MVKGLNLNKTHGQGNPHPLWARQRCWSPPSKLTQEGIQLNLGLFWVRGVLLQICICYKCRLDFNYLPSYLGMALTLSFQLISTTTKAGNLFLLCFWLLFFNQKASLSLTHSTEGNGALRKPPNMGRLMVKVLLEDLLTPQGTGVFSDLPWHDASLRITHHLPAGQVQGSWSCFIWGIKLCTGWEQLLY